MAEYTQGIKIDGISFNIPLISIKRTADFLDKYAERTEDGILRRELIGVYFNYQMSFGIIDDDMLYARLWDKLTEPVEFHVFELPTSNSTLSFSGYLSGISDEVEKMLRNGAKFKGLQCKFTAKVPARIPD